MNTRPNFIAAIIEKYVQFLDAKVKERLLIEFNQFRNFN